MIVFLNGQFVPQEQAVVSVLDRAFLYGDGLFETVRVFNGRPFRWAQHFERLRRGAEYLRIPLPLAETALLGFVLELVERNSLPDAFLRLTLSRGVGRRGYSPKGADSPAQVMTLYPAPESTPQALRWKLITASIRLPARTLLAQFKTSNKLPQILARAEADAAGADDAVLINTDGYVVESSSGNLFWVDEGVVCTPPLESGILPGVTRQVVLECCRALGVPTQEAAPRPKELLRAEGAFLTLSSLGVVAVVSLDGHTLAKSPLTSRIQEHYQHLLASETA